MYSTRHFFSYAFILARLSFYPAELERHKLDPKILLYRGM